MPVRFVNTRLGDMGLAREVMAFVSDGVISVQNGTIEVIATKEIIDRWSGLYDSEKTIVAPVKNNLFSCRVSVETHTKAREVGYQKISLTVQTAVEKIIDNLPAADPQEIYGSFESTTTTEQEQEKDSVLSSVQGDVGTLLFLAAAAAVIDAYGYLSVTEAKAQNKESTKVLSFWLATDKFSHAETKDISITTEHHTIAADTLEWMADRGNDGTEYGSHLYRISNYTRMTFRDAGFAASAVWAKQRNDKQSQVKKGNHLGTVGHVAVIAVTLKRIGGYQNKYGETFIYNFETDSGDVVIWSTQKTKFELNIDIGQSVVISGKVKKHSDYKGVKQTEITRAKIVT